MKAKPRIKLLQLIVACFTLWMSHASFASSILFDFEFGEGDLMFTGTVGFPVTDGQPEADSFSLFLSTDPTTDLSTQRGGGPQLIATLVDGMLVGTNFTGPFGPTEDGPDSGLFIILTGTDASMAGVDDLIGFFFGLDPIQFIDANTLIFTPVNAAASPGVSPVPLPAAVWLFMTGLLAAFGLSKRSKNRL